VVPMNPISSRLAPRAYVRTLNELFARNADPVRAAAMAAYMRNLFAFHGIMSTPRTELTRSFVAEHGLPAADDLDEVIRLLWMHDHRELQYAAMDLLLRLRKHLTPGHLELIEHCITNKSWWDTVDALAPRLAGWLYASHTAELAPDIERWIRAEDFWLNRSAIILQLGYKERTDTGLLTRAILPHIASREFFLQKAIGWALRQYSYTDADWVTDFVRTQTLAPLSTREALKALKRSAERTQRR
jgi:3-methyladenine DNA glycosylase AlkD